MESVYLLIPVSVVLVFLIAYLFWQSVRGGQFDDLEGPGFRILMDDDTAKPRITSTDPQKKQSLAASEPKSDNLQG